MAQVKLELRNKNVPEKVLFIRNVVTKLTGNAFFTAPDPSLASLTGIAQALEAKFQEREAAAQTALELTTLLEATEAEADRLLTAEGSYVEGKSKGDAAQILSAGMEVRSDAAPVGVLPAPEDFAVTAGDFEGELDASWDRVAGAKSYVIQSSPDPISATSWAYRGTATKSRYTVKGLESGKKVWLRVSAVGTAGESPWSTPAGKIVP